MTKKELIEKLSVFPDNMTVVIPDAYGDFEIAPVEQVYKEDIRWSDGELESREICIVITNKIV